MMPAKRSDFDQQTLEYLLISRSMNQGRLIISFTQALLQVAVSGNLNPFIGGYAQEDMMSIMGEQFFLW